MNQDKIRNVAIIAHVDHGKTTMVDQLFKQSGMFRSNQAVEERLMDSMDLERERGITIQSKNGACKYKDFFINIIDTPGHADFGGEVERVLLMADGVLLLVDAAEGPMPQSYFVLKKALAKDLPVIVVINKIDKPAARPDWVIDQVFDLFVELGAKESILDFPIIYSSAKNGWATFDLAKPNSDILPVFEKIVEYIPAPKGDINNPFQMLVSSISYSSFLGKLSIGKVTQGKVDVNQEVAIAFGDNIKAKKRISKIYKFESNKQVEAKSAQVGEIIAVAGLEDVKVGETLTDPINPNPLPGIEIDPPTLSMLFLPNDSPFAGREGKFVTSRHIRERLFKELLSDVALQVEDCADSIGYKVSGRGELHLSVLIEKMRREGYEFQVSSPEVIYKIENGKKLEPYEELTIDVDEENMGKVIENLGRRKGQLIEMSQEQGMNRLKYKIPTRGLLGYLSEFMTETKGMGVMNSIFLEYGPYVGELKTRSKGVAIAKETCTTVAYALWNLQERIKMFMGPGIDVYGGQIIGENAREGDLVVNPAKAKKLTNMRASGTDEAVVLIPHLNMSLEQSIAYIDDTELVEITPKSIRLRKKILNEIERKRIGFARESADE